MSMPLGALEGVNEADELGKTALAACLEVITLILTRTRTLNLNLNLNLNLTLTLTHISSGM